MGKHTPQHTPQSVNVAKLSNRFLMILVAATSKPSPFTNDEVRIIGGEAWLRGLLVTREDVPTNEIAAIDRGPELTTAGEDS